MSSHPAEAGEPGAEDSPQPMKDVLHNPGDAPHTGVNLEKSRLVGGKADIWRGSGGTYASGSTDDILPQRCKVKVESNHPFFKIKVKFLQFQTSSYKFKLSSETEKVLMK